MSLNKKFSIKDKIELSKILEKVEIKFDQKQTLDLLDDLHKKSRAHVIGITGPPGVGKSSMINRLISNYRKSNFSVGVLAIDPSSKRSGGALLGDRARFDIDPGDNKVFVRSMAAKDYLGGIAELTYPYMVVMRSIFDLVIIESVGVGQSEISIENVTDTVIYCVQPGSGDVIQFMKSGIIEIPDIICVTKNDLEELSNITVADLLSSKSFFTNNLEWDIKITSVSSNKNQGFNSLISLLDERWKWMNKDGKLEEKRFFQDNEWIKKRVTNKYGSKGLSILQKRIKTKSSPFSFFFNLENKIIIKYQN